MSVHIQAESAKFIHILSLCQNILQVIVHGKVYSIQLNNTLSTTADCHNTEYNGKSKEIKTYYYTFQILITLFPKVIIED